MAAPLVVAPVVLDFGAVHMSAALARIDDFNPGAMTRQRQLPHEPLRDFAKSFHSSSLPVPQLWTGAEEMSFPSGEKFSTRDDHLKRVSDALERRLYPNTPLHQKVLAAAIGVTRHTVNNWLRCRCEPGSHDMELLGRFFESTEGGPQFLWEIYGDLAEPRSRRRTA